MSAIKAFFNKMSEQRDERMKGKKELRDMAQRQRKQNRLLRKLARQGHTCVLVLETYPSQVSWCKEKKCTANTGVSSSSNQNCQPGMEF